MFFLFFLIAATLIKFYLVQRQARVLEANRAAVPSDFAGHITLPVYQKALAYSLDKLAWQQYGDFWQALLLLMFTVLGGLNFCAYMAVNLTSSLIGQDLLLIILFLLINYFLTLPFTVYENFKLEAKHGFNNMTPKLFCQDQLKVLLLAALLFLPLITLILYLRQSTGSLWWFYTWLLWSVFSLLMLAVFPRFIAPLFNTFKPLDNQELMSAIKHLLEQTGFTAAAVLVMDGSKRSGHANAYFTGFGKNKRIVFFDTLLVDLSCGEITAVLAHELGHFKLKHITRQLILTLGLTLIILFVLGQLIDNPLFYLGLGINPDYIGFGMGLILFFLVLPVFTFMFSPLFKSLSRQHEYAADCFAARLTSGPALIAALTKLYKQNAASLIGDKWYSCYYDSHPNAENRLAALKRQQDCG